jgi:hemerythrin HHE cation binding domain-containing protein
MSTTTSSRTARTAAAPASTETPRRHDGYCGIHKALRCFMADTLTRVGNTDPFDPKELDATLAQVADLMDVCELHIHDENAYIHPALERAQPGSASRIAGEHVHHLDAIQDLRDLAALAAHTEGEARAHAMSRLYKAMALFVADNFEHMNHEETEHNAVLWAHYTDAELLEIERRLKASIPPQAMVKILHWFMPALNAPERTAMMKTLQKGMPPEVFVGVLDIARRTIKLADYVKLTRSLGIAQAA